MNDTEHRPIRELLLGFAALAVSIASLLPLCWGVFILGEYGSRDTDPFPGFLRGAAFVSLVVIISGAFAIGPFWRASPLWVAFVASAPYLFFALVSGDALGISIWSGARFLVFAVFYAITRLCRVPSTVA